MGIELLQKSFLQNALNYLMATNVAGVSGRKKKKRWLPGTQHMQLVMAKIWSRQNHIHFARWLISAMELTTFDDLIVAVEEALEAVLLDDNSHNQAVVTEAYEALVVGMKAFKRSKYHTPPLTTLDYHDLGLSPDDETRTSVKKCPNHGLVLSATPIGAFMAKLVCAIEGVLPAYIDPDDYFYEVRAVVGEGANAKVYIFRSTKSVFNVSFVQEETGMPVTYTCCLVTKGTFIPGDVGISFVTTVP